jgi:hypothetical protein
MTPEQQQALTTHVQAIAQILYDDSDLQALQTLEGIEVTLRSQLQKHVSPWWCWTNRAVGRYP